MYTMRKYFGTDGIRGVANVELTPELAYKVAKSSAYVLAKNFTGEKPVVLIGKDTRISGDMLETAMVSGFCAAGIDVILLGVIPTPAVAYLTKKMNAIAGVVISASHNSYEFNGIKYFSNKGMKISDEIEEEIENLFESEKLNEINVSHEKLGICKKIENCYEEYIELFNTIFKGNLELKNDFVVGIDASNGATYAVAENIFKNLGVNYKIINNNPNGININKECGSTHMEGLRKFVLENKLNLGVAYDGDGDRCLCIDDKGNMIDGDKMLAVISLYLKSKQKLNNNTLVATVMSNLGLSKFAKENDLDLLKAKVGDRYVLEEMIKNGHNLGGEQSGHVILLDYNPTGDGILTSIMMIQIILEYNKKLSEICDIIKAYPQVLINAKVSNAKKHDYAKNETVKNEIENLEKEFADNGRVLIRPSGTEPLVRVMIEGEDITYITKKAEELVALIEKELK